MLIKRLLIASCILFMFILGACADEEIPEGPPPVDPLPDDIPSLLDMLTEPQQTRSNEIMDALVAKGDPAIPMIFDVLEDNRDFQEPASFALSKFGVDAVDDCIDALSSQYMHVRYASVRALGDIGADAEPATESLMDLFGRTLKSEQKIIMETLQKITSDTSAILMVKAALRVSDLRYDAMRTLGKWGPAAEVTTDSLVYYLDNEDPQVIWESMDALEQIGSNDSVIEGIANVLGSELEARIRKKAAQVLGVFGPDAAGATTALADALDDEDLNIQEFSARSLGLIAPESRAAIPALIDALTAESPQTRREAAIALGNFGAEASSALDSLKNVEADENEQEYIRRAATEAIAAIEAG